MHILKPCKGVKPEKSAGKELTLRQVKAKFRGINKISSHVWLGVGVDISPRVTLSKALILRAYTANPPAECLILNPETDCVADFVSAGEAIMGLGGALHISNLEYVSDDVFEMQRESFAGAHCKPPVPVN